MPFFEFDSSLNCWIIFHCMHITQCVYCFALFFILVLLFLLHSTVLVLPYIDMNPPRVYTSSQSWIPFPPPIPYHLSGSSPCTSPKHPVSCIEHRLVLPFLHDSIHVSMPFSQIIPPSRHVPQSKMRNVSDIRFSQNLVSFLID